MYFSEDHEQRLDLVMLSNDFTERQKDIVRTVHKLWGQRQADRLVGYFIKAQKQAELFAKMVS